MKPLVIVNPQAGHGKAGRNWKVWQRRLTNAVGTFEVVFTQHGGHAETLTRQAIREGYRHIHAVGGDGTLNEVVAGFFQGDQPLCSETLLSIWPAGTGCDFHRGLLHPTIRSQPGTDQVTSIDVGHLSFMDHQQRPADRYFLNIASCGVSGLVDQLIDRKWKSLGGRLGFFVNTVEALFRYKNRRVRIRTNHGDLGERLVRLVAIANGKYFGGGMKIAPDAQIDDGSFQLVIVGDVGILEVLAATPRLYAGTHLSHPKIEAQNVTWVELTSDEEVLLDLDGEALGTLPLRARVIPAAIRLKTY